MPTRRSSDDEPSVRSALLDYDGAAKYLATSVRQVRRLKAEGRLTYVQIGRSIRFRPRDLEMFIDSQTVG